MEKLSAVFNHRDAFEANRLWPAGTQPADSSIFQTPLEDVNSILRTKNEPRAMGSPGARSDGYADANGSSQVSLSPAE